MVRSTTLRRKSSACAISILGAFHRFITILVTVTPSLNVFIDADDDSPSGQFLVVEITRVIFSFPAQAQIVVKDLTMLQVILNYRRCYLL